MNQWIQILAPGGRTAVGGQQPSSPVYTGWAAVTKLSGAELLKAQQIVQQVTHEVVIPYPNIGVAQSERMPQSGTITFDGRVLQIESISDPDERKVELRILCVERNQNV